MAYSLPAPYGRAVFMRSALAVLLLATATPALAQRADQDEATAAARSGRIRPLGDILSRIRPGMRGSFLGSEYAPGDDRYRLKFMRRGVVEAVDVDARTGEVVGDRPGRGDDREAYRERRWQEFNERRSRDGERMGGGDDRRARDGEDRPRDGDRRGRRNRR